MGYKTTWKNFHKIKDEMLGEIGNKTVTVKYDSYFELEKAWVVTVNNDKYILPKSKTVIFPEKKTIDVPNWLHVKVFTEQDDKKF